jgi:hypothetical protein
MKKAGEIGVTQPVIMKTSSKSIPWEDKARGPLVGEDSIGSCSVAKWATHLLLGPSHASACP